MLMGSLIFLGLMIILAAALMDTAGGCGQAKKCMRKEVESMSKYRCGRPEWADNEECPIEIGEAENCADCYWGREQEDE